MKREIRESFVEELRAIKKENDKLVVLVSDSTSTCKISPFLEENPDSVINVGIAEQNLIGIAAGLSLGGLLPFTANATPFLLGRSNEQVKTDICYSDTNVKLVGLNPGFAYGSLGPTHHCLDDISTTLSLGNIQIFAPCDPEETKQITRYAAEYNGPVYIRLDSFKAENIHKVDYAFEPGNSVVIKEGTDITFITMGTIVHTALEAVSILEKKGISVEVLNIPSIRPLKNNGIIKSINKTKKVLTMEEHSLHGGIGSIIGDIILEENLNCTLKRLGVTTGSFAPASPREDIKEDYNLHTNGIVAKALELLKKS